MLQNYEQIVEKIVKFSNVSKDEIERRVEAKRAKLSGLVSKEGAAQIVAAELGVNFEKERFKVSEIVDGMRRVNLTVKTVRINPVRTYVRNGQENKVLNMVLGDETGSTRGVLWDTNQIRLFEDGVLKEGDVVEIVNSSIRNNEIHLTAFSDIKKSTEIIDNVQVTKSYVTKNISELRNGDNANVRAVIVQVFEPRSFDRCPECNGKLIRDSEGEKCETHGRVVPRKGMVFSFVLDDGTENIRAVTFNQGMEKFGVDETNFADKRQGIIGKEAIFVGNIRQNKMYNNTEMVVEDIREIDLDELIKELEQGKKGL